jgi:DNA-nicking Smr family endonuclease
VQHKHRSPDLRPEDAALWASVAASVEPIQGRKLPSALTTTLPINANPPQQWVGCPHTANRRATSNYDIGQRPRPGNGLGTKSPHPPQNTLDGNWDKRLALGTVRPDFVIDLHEHSAAAAHARLAQGLDAAITEGARIVLLITGKARGAENPRLPPTTRGVIRASVIDWIAGSIHNRAVAAIRNAHPRHGGAGALYLIMRRVRAAPRE